MDEAYWEKIMFGDEYVFFIQDLRFLLWEYDIENKL